MENKNTITIVLVIIGLVVGLGAGYLLAPEKVQTETETQIVEVPKLDGKTIRIGYITPLTARLETEVPFMEDIVVPQLNDYASKLSYDVEFEILVDSADGQAAIQLEKVQSFNSMGIELVVGGIFSSHSQASIPYLNENDMLMISPGASSPLLSIENDRWYRTSITDRYRAPVAIDVLEDWGFKALVYFQTADAFGDGLWNILEPEWTDRGGLIVERIRVAAEATEYSNYLDTMNTIVVDAVEEYGEERVGIFVASTAQLSVLVSQSADYPALQQVIWMGAGSSGRNQRVVDNAGEDAVKLRIMSALQEPESSAKWDNFNEEYMEVTGLAASFQEGASIDAQWLFALCVLETQSEASSDVVEVLPTVGDNYFGTTGNCAFDEYGDRIPGLHAIWGYAMIDGNPGFTRYGSYDYGAKTVVWNEELLAEQGISRPGPAT